MSWTYWTWVETGWSLFVPIFGYFLILFYVPRVLFYRRQPGATLAWLVVIILFPYLGILFYIFFGNNRIARRSKLKIEADRKFAKSAAGLTQKAPPANVERIRRKLTFRHLEKLSSNLGLRPATDGNLVELFNEGEASMNALMDAILTARHHIHMEYFVFQPDTTGRRVRDALIDAIDRGVKVRLMYDSLGSLRLLAHPRFFDPLRKAGGEVAIFMPFFRRGFSSVINLRNHRKLTIVDGRSALTGGSNIGDEYLSWESRLEQWRDMQILIHGPAVESFQLTFLSDWAFITGKEILDPAYFPQPDTAGDMMVQVFPSGPDDSVANLQRVFFSLITHAREHIYLTTPYFVPDDPISTALKTAALSGLDVHLLLPGKSNHRMVDWAAKSYYREFLEAGVHINHYEHGMLHAKILTVDGLWSVMGSANMDMRSFRLNFEINTILYSAEFASRLEEVFVRDITASRRVHREEILRWGWGRRLRHGAARVLGPVL